MTSGTHTLIDLPLLDIVIPMTDVYDGIVLPAE